MTIKIIPHQSEHSTQNENVVWIYFNGICSNQAIPWQNRLLEIQTGIISKAFPGCLGWVFNNPTDLKDYFQRNPKIEDALISRLTQLLRETIQSHSTKKIIVLTHSHGAYITSCALKNLTSQELFRLQVHAFAGVTMIPHRFANAHNYIYREDLIAHDGSLAFEGVSGTLVKLKQTVTNVFSPPLEAEYTKTELAIREHPQELDQRLQYFNDTFWKGEVQPLSKDTETDAKKHLSFLDQYNITLLSRSPTVVAEKASIGLTINEHFHILPNFQRIIETIATRALETSHQSDPSIAARGASEGLIDTRTTSPYIYYSRRRAKSDSTWRAKALSGEELMQALTFDQPD